MLDVVSNFLDIEAAVDNDEDDSSEYETDDLGTLLQFDEARLTGSSTAEFVEDDTNEDTSAPQVYRWRVSEDDVRPKVLENIAQAIKSRERSTRTSEHGHAYDSSDGFIHLLPTEKDLVWSVRVKVRQGTHH
jgi:hypothetical protein